MLETAERLWEIFDPDNDSLLQLGEFTGFLREFHTNDSIPEDFCQLYWSGIDAFDQQYRGVKSLDFIACLVDWEQKACLSKDESVESKPSFEKKLTIFEKSSTSKTEQQNLEGNEAVKKIRDSLRPFEYESSPPHDGVTRNK